MDIDYLCGLNRFRDVTKEECGTRIVVEEGIIDEMLRQSFDLKRMSIPHKTSFFGKKVEEENCLGFYDKLSKKDKILAGHYVIFKNDDVHPFDGYFKACAYKYRKGFNDKSDHENLMLEGVLQGIECLVKLSNGELNQKINKNFGFEVNSIDDFKDILMDYDKSKSLCKYLVTSAGNSYYKSVNKGTHPDYYKVRKTNNYKETWSYFAINYLYLDKTYNKDDENKDLYDKFMNIEDEDDIEIKTIYHYLSKNLNHILTNKQIEYIKNTLEDKDFLDKVTPHKSTYKSKYKKSITKSIEEFLQDNQYVKKTEYGYVDKKDIIDTLEDILRQNTQKESFIKLCEYLKKENKVAETLIDIVYSLEPRVYEPIAMYFNNELDINDKYTYRYFENDFMKMINLLQKEYNFQIDNNIIIYNYNRSEEERKWNKIKMFVDDIINDDNVAFLVPQGYKPIEGYNNVDDIVDLRNSLFNDKKTRLKFILDKIGYKMKRSAVMMDGEAVYMIKIYK